MEQRLEGGKEANAAYNFSITFDDSYMEIRSKTELISSLSPTQKKYLAKYRATNNITDIICNDNNENVLSTLQREIEELRNELSTRVYSMDVDQTNINQTSQELSIAIGQIEELTQRNRQLEESIEIQQREWQQRQNSYLNILGAAKASVEEMKRNHLIELQAKSSTGSTKTIDRQIIERPKLTITDAELEENFRNIDNLSVSSSSFVYNTTQLFSMLDTSVASSNPVWEYLFRILLTATGMANSTKFLFSVENVKILLIIFEGALRTFPDTAIDEAIDYVRNRIQNNNFTFREPLFLATRHVPNSLQSLIFSNLTSLYKQKFDIMPTVSSVDLFRRHIPVTGLNTYRYDPNNAKTSIYIYKTETLDQIQKK